MLSVEHKRRAIAPKNWLNKRHALHQCGLGCRQVLSHDLHQILCGASLMQTLTDNKTDS